MLKEIAKAHNATVAHANKQHKMAVWEYRLLQGLVYGCISFIFVLQCRNVGNVEGWYHLAGFLAFALFTFRYVVSKTVAW
jgi:hypothetical protein